MSLTKRRWRFAAASLLVPFLLQAILLSFGKALHVTPGPGWTLWWIVVSCAAGVVTLAVGFRIYALGLALFYVPAVAFGLFWFSAWFLGLWLTGPPTLIRIDVG
jgi:hypothetical protein